MILHDYPDSKAIDLLKITGKAMAAYSILIIDELVIPNKGAHEHATQFDLTMLAGLASMERTASQWNSLLNSAGFEILDNKAYASTGGSIIVVRPKAYHSNLSDAGK